MAGFEGADTVELNRLGVHMDQAADALTRIRDEVAADLRHTHWDGGDAADFRDLWSRSLAGRLHNAIEATRLAAKSLHDNATQQDDASRDGGSGGFGPLIPYARLGTGSDGPVDPLLRDLEWIHKHLTLPAEFLEQTVLVVGKALAKTEALQWLADYADLPAVGFLADSAEALGIVNIGINGFLFVHGLITDPRSPETFSAGVSTALAIGAYAAFAAGFGPVGLGVLGVEVVWSLLPPDVHAAVEHDIAVGARFVGHAAYDAAKFEVTTTLHAAEAVGRAGIEVGRAEVHAAELVGRAGVEVGRAEVHAVEAVGGAAVHTAEAVGGAISGGVGAVKHILHW